MKFGAFRRRLAGEIALVDPIDEMPPLRPVLLPYVDSRIAPGKMEDSVNGPSFVGEWSDDGHPRRVRAFNEWSEPARATMTSLSTNTRYRVVARAAPRLRA